ncbi:hypothetical protein HYY70_06020 [Candidatus Woesearchaeota archaeon]|nr:hypothetical protein [Candidatus Woesearchaeota archaeon]
MVVLDPVKLYIEEKFKWRVTQPFYTPVSEPRPEYVVGKEGFVETLVNYLFERYFIEDDFQDHGERRGFYEKIGNADTKLVDRLSLSRGNIINGVVGAMQFIIWGVEDKFPDLYVRLKEVALPETDPDYYKYSELEPSKQKTFVLRLQKSVHAFLEALSK